MKKRVFLLLVCITLLSTSAFVCGQYLSFGWPKSESGLVSGLSGYFYYVPVKSYSFGTSTQTLLDAGIKSWNSSYVDMAFVKRSASNNQINVGSYTWSAYGRNSLTYSGSNLIKFEISVNTRRINEDATNYNNFFRSVWVHELGHSIWLADNPSTTMSSIMKYSRDRNTMISPSVYDRESVRAKY